MLAFTYCRNCLTVAAGSWVARPVPHMSHMPSHRQNCPGWHPLFNSHIPSPHGSSNCGFRPLTARKALTSYLPLLTLLLCSRLSSPFSHTPHILCSSPPGRTHQHLHSTISTVNYYSTMIDPLERLKNKVARRMSDLSVFDFTLVTDRTTSGSSLSVIDPEQRLRSSSFSHPTQNPLHLSSHSRSVSKKHAKALIRQETALVVLKKLLNLLAEVGLQHPITLKTTGGLGAAGPSLRLVMVHVCNSNDCVYLPPATSASRTYEDEENGVGLTDSDTTAALPVTEAWAAGGSEDSDSTSSSQPGPLRFWLPNYLCTLIDSSDPIPHLFGVIVELVKDTCVKNVRVSLLLDVVQMWPSSDPHNRYLTKERFSVGLLEWNLLLHNADYYVSTSNSNDTRSAHVSPTALSARTRNYQLVDVHELAAGSDSVNLRKKPRLSFSDSTSEPHGTVTSEETLKAGLYVFLLPVLLPSHIPATITSINGLLAHTLSVNVARVSEKILRRSNVSASFNLPMVRTPPSLANSTADKPIYVNKTWNDALNYVVTFPRKYVALGSEHTVNLKLIPLVKDVIVKRIKFNVLERITYVSRDLTREYDYDGEDPFNNKGLLRVRERVVPLCELRTKQKASGFSEPFKEVVIKCRDNNLLYSCYESEALNHLSDPLSRPSPDELVMIASPLDINVALPFLTTKSDKDFKIPAYDDYDDAMPGSPRRSSSHTRASSVLSAVCPSSPIIGSLETHISHISGNNLLNSDLDEDHLRLHSTEMVLEENQKLENYAAGYTSTAKALAPDSNFRHIQISHRLQICFRISKPDPNDNFRMHHYEVVIDTPLILLSARCNDDSIQLPRYNVIDRALSPPAPPGINFRQPTFSGNGVSITRLEDANFEPLPSFEEATSTPASPMMRAVSISEDGITRVLSVTPNDPAPAYEEVNTQTPADMLGSLSIDDLVLDSPNSLRDHRESLIKASLQNSFAPGCAARPRSEISTSTGPSSKSDDSSDIRPTELDEPSSIAVDSISSMVDDSLDISSSRMPFKAELQPLSNECTTGDLGMVADNDNASETFSGDEESSVASFRADNSSLFTQDTNFIQRVPLLTVESIDSVPQYSSQRSAIDLSKSLTETLDKPVDLFHAY